MSEAFRSPEVYNIPFRNGNSTETIPAFGVMYQGLWSVVKGIAIPYMVKPGPTFFRKCYVNGPFAVQAGRFGSCSSLDGAGGWVLFDEDSSVDENGDAIDPEDWQDEQSWGPTDGSYLLSKNSSGFTYTVSSVYGGMYNKFGDAYDEKPARFIARQCEVNTVFIKSTAKLHQGGALNQQPILIGMPLGVRNPSTYADGDAGGETVGIMKLNVVYDRLIDPDTESGWSIAANAYMKCDWINGYWYVTESSKCAAPPSS